MKYFYIIYSGLKQMVKDLTLFGQTVDKGILEIIHIKN